MHCETLTAAGPTAAELDTIDRRILRAIEEFTAANTYPPTVVELAQAVGRSVRSVHTHLKALEERGVLRRTRGARTLVIERSTMPLADQLILAVEAAGELAGRTRATSPPSSGLVNLNAGETFPAPGGKQGYQELMRLASEGLLSAREEARHMLGEGTSLVRELFALTDAGYLRAHRLRAEVADEAAIGAV